MRQHQIIYFTLILFFAFLHVSCDEEDKTVPENKTPVDMNDDSKDDMNDSTNDSEDDMDDSTNDSEDNNDNALVAPNFSLSSIDGITVSLSQHKGKVVVLFFLGNTCPSCKGVAPEVQNKLVNTYSADNNFVLIGIDQWNGSKASLEGFRSSTNTTFSLLLNGASVANDYNTTYDRLIVIDKEGYIRFKGTRNVSNDLNAAIDVVKNYIN